MEIRWEEITGNHLDHLDEVFKLYNNTFPFEVRETDTIFLKSLAYAEKEKHNNFRFIAGFEGEELVSFATGHYLADVNSGFIVYIVTNPAVRSKGLGAKTLFKMEQLLKEDAIRAGNLSLESLILETETEEMAHTAEEKEDCVKRKTFFERNDYKLLEGIHYLQPPLHPGDNSIRLNLYLKTLKESVITSEEVKEIIRAMYKEKYEKVNEIEKSILNHCLEKMGLIH
ncbi:GNAT family N-acetyltransferase [Metabacillus dongyingensis]|uniref:GNAT family N-acetyltransferase n=1 Tax=Metabacillus dongyingensis TaxID=2874282 RepID=UPI003B8D681E